MRARVFCRSVGRPHRDIYIYILEHVVQWAGGLHLHILGPTTRSPPSLPPSIRVPPPSLKAPPPPPLKGPPGFVEGCPPPPATVKHPPSPVKHPPSPVQGSPRPPLKGAPAPGAIRQTLNPRATKSPAPTGEFQVPCDRRGASGSATPPSRLHTTDHPATRPKSPAANWRVPRHSHRRAPRQSPRPDRRPPRAGQPRRRRCPAGTPARSRGSRGASRRAPGDGAGGRSRRVRAPGLTRTGMPSPAAHPAPSPRTHSPHRSERTFQPDPTGPVCLFIDSPTIVGYGASRAIAPCPKRD